MGKDSQRRAKKVSCATSRQKRRLSQSKTRFCRTPKPRHEVRVICDFCQKSAAKKKLCSESPSMGWLAVGSFRKFLSCTRASSFSSQSPIRGDAGRSYSCLASHSPDGCRVPHGQDQLHENSHYKVQQEP